MKESISTEKKKRLEDLYDLQILDTPYEESFNEIVDLASDICEVPVSLITFIDETRQWFKAKTGIEAQETSLLVSFCAHALHRNSLFVVPDATKDSRFVNNDLVTAEPNVRFYAGSPFYSPNGYPLGTLCVIDFKPRELTWKQASALKTLSNQVTKLVELHYKSRRNAELSTEVENHLKKVEKLQVARQRENIICQAQLDNFSKFLLQELELLKTGRFTKRELSDIYFKAEHYEQQVQKCKEGFWILNQIRNKSEELQAEPIAISNEVENIKLEMERACKETGNKLLTYVSNELEIVQYKVVFDLTIRSILNYIISNVQKAEIFIVAARKEDGVEIRVPITNKNLQSDLQKYLSFGSLDAANSNLWFVELAVISEILAEIGGNLELHKFGDEGTSISIYVPTIKKTWLI